MTTSHLTDEQFSDLLAGDSAPEAACMHLEQCASCCAELVELRSAMGSFNGIGLAWAEAEAPRRIHPPSRWALQRGALPSWGLAAATALTIAAVGIHREVMPRPVPETAAVAMSEPSSSQPSGNEIAEDNRLMMSIDQELSYQPQPSVPVSELRGGDSNPSPERQVSN